MQEKSHSEYRNDFDDEIDLKELFDVASKGKWIIASITTFVSVLGVVYSLALPNIYESKALLFPVNPSSGFTEAIQRSYTGLASLSGINIPSRDDEGNSIKAIVKIGTLSFFENNILKNIHLPDLMAVKSWDSKTNQLTYNESIYDVESNTWVRDYVHPKQQIPSAQESYKIFKTNHLNLSEDKISGFVTLSIKHQSPSIAKEWSELIIDEVNSFYRQKDKTESEKAVNYLNKQISMTGLSEIKQVLAQLLQEETKKLTLIEANQSYVFDYIDPPAIMEQKKEPKRSLILIVSILFGLMLGIIFVISKHYLFSKRIKGL